MGIKSFSKERLGAVHRPEMHKRLSEHAVKIQIRRYQCPFNGERDLVGYSHEARPTVFVRDHFFFPWLDQPHVYQHLDRIVPVAFSGFVEFFVSAGSGFCMENQDFFNQGKLQYPPSIMKYYEAHCGPKATAPVTTRDLFYRALAARQDLLLSVDWFTVAQNSDVLTLTGYTKFSKRPELLPRLLAAHLKVHTMGTDHRLFVQTEKEIAEAIQGGFVGMLVAHSCESPAIMSLLSGAKILELGHRLIALSDLPAEWFGRGVEPLRCTLDALRTMHAEPAIGPGIERLTAATLLREVLRYAVVSPVDQIASRRASLLTAFYTSELLLDAKPFDYSTGRLNPNAFVTNNEAPIYLNLLLRSYLRIPDDRCRHDAESLRKRLREALNTRLYKQISDSSRRRNSELLTAAIARCAEEYLDLRA